MAAVRRTGHAHACLTVVLTAFLLRFCLVADQLPMLVFLAVQAFHNLMAHGTVQHFNKSKTLWLTAERIPHQLGVNNLAKFGAELGYIRFSDGVRQVTDKKFHAFPLSGGVCISMNF